MSGPEGEQPVPLGKRMLEYYVGMLTEHSNNPDKCQICDVHNCQDWRFAKERLMVSGEPK